MALVHDSVDRQPMTSCVCVCGGRAGGGCQKVTPLVTVTHYLSHQPCSHSESDLIVVMSVYCSRNPILQDLFVSSFVVIIIESERNKLIITVLIAPWRLFGDNFSKKKNA